MKKTFLISALFSLSIIVNGCLVFHSVSYEVTPGNNRNGSAVVVIEDIRSDAMNAEELDMDKDNLFRFIYRSEEFISQMQDEGKNITGREFEVNGEKLNGKIYFTFDDIELVEGILYEDPYYFLTIPMEDSIISTNGEVVASAEHKRIIWDNTIKTLKFKMFSDEVDSESLVGMAQFYDPDK